MRQMAPQNRFRINGIGSSAGCSTGIVVYIHHHLFFHRLISSITFFLPDVCRAFLLTNFVSLEHGSEHCDNVGIEHSTDLAASLSLSELWELSNIDDHDRERFSTLN